MASNYIGKCPLCISIMSGKMKGIRALSTNPLTNPFCQKMALTNSICADCYSRKMLQGLRKNQAPAFERNSQMLSSSIMEMPELPVNFEVFRINAHGEIINGTHAANIHQLIEKNPRIFFGWWTKRRNLVRPRRGVKNVNYIFSNARVNDPNPRVPKGYNKVFSVYTPEYAKANGIKINCKGAKEGGCQHCMICYRPNEITHVNEVLR